MGSIKLRLLDHKRFMYRKYTTCNKKLIDFLSLLSTSDLFHHDESNKEDKDDRISESLLFREDEAFWSWDRSKTIPNRTISKIDCCCWVFFKLCCAYPLINAWKSWRDALCWSVDSTFLPRFMPCLLHRYMVKRRWFSRNVIEVGFWLHPPIALLSPNSFCLSEKVF